MLSPEARIRRAARLLALAVQAAERASNDLARVGQREATKLSREADAHLCGLIDVRTEAEDLAGRFEMAEAVRRLEGGARC